MDCVWNAPTGFVSDNPRRAEPSGRGMARDAGPPFVPTDCSGTRRVCLMSWVCERWAIYRPEGPVMPGRYKSLYQYLENRYANTVVLTFAQIEDLLGFPLPDSARVDHEWWANKDPNDTPQPHSRSWTLASRTATPNLQAQTVVFERAQN